MAFCNFFCDPNAGPPYPAGTFVPNFMPPASPCVVCPTPTITPAAAVADLPATAELTDVITTVNELLASLRAAGFLAE